MPCDKALWLVFVTCMKAPVYVGLIAKQVILSSTSECILCVTAGTSLELEGDELSWMSGLDHVTVSMHNLAVRDLIPDRDIILPSM